MSSRSDTPAQIREPGSLPFPGRPVGTANAELPFEHIVVVMMENHSFDNLLGALSRDRPDVDGLSFVDGQATNVNPGDSKTPGPVTAFPFQSTAQGSEVSQTWKDTHEEINGGAMDGFVRSTGSSQPMGYYTAQVLPFAYSLASQFTLANRWFCSLPGPTYPNRRFLLAGTAFGGTATNTEELWNAFLKGPPNGTIFDLLSSHNIDWTNYFSDIPMTTMIPSTIIDHPDHHALIGQFFEDCQTGKLPAVSFLDPRIGSMSRIGSPIASLPSPLREALAGLGVDLASEDPAETEEDPQNLYYGEDWAWTVVNAVLHSPQWPQTLLVYTYDEHGGYYDHVPPPAAIAPDDIAPVLQAGEPPGGYDRYGPRVPAVVVSPYSKPAASTDVVHDHTSVLATIEAKWNLPALTRRDANAATVLDFLDPTRAALLHPPTIQRPSLSGPSGPVTAAP